MNPAKKLTVAATSCRIVSFKTFENELARNGLCILEKGITRAVPNYRSGLTNDSLMYAVVKQNQIDTVDNKL